MIRSSLVIVALFLTAFLAAAAPADDLQAKHDEAAGTISIFRAGDDQPIVTQNARADFRPYLHPIVAPDGQVGAVQPRSAMRSSQSLASGFL